MTSDEIKQNVIELIYKLFFIKVSGDMEDEWLTGEKIKLDGIQMVYLFDAVEKKFAIHIPPEKLENYAFATVNGIVKIVCDFLQRNELN